MSKYKTTWQHIRRSPYQSFLAITVMTLTFFVVGLVLYVAFASSSLLNYFEQKPQITVFFSDDKTAESVKQLETKLKKTEKIATVKYVSKDEALKIYQDRFKSDPLLLEMVTADILPASLEVSTVKPEYLSDVAQILKGEMGINEVIYQKDIIDTLLTWTNTIRRVGTALIIFFSLLSILVMLTITGMKIVLRKEEIEILKLVGATKWYISSPFYSEGMFYGIMGAFLGWGLVYILLLYSTPFLSSLFQGIPALSFAFGMTSLSLPNITFSIWPVAIEFMGLLLGLLVLFGIAISAIGTLIALWRYVRF